MTLLFVSPFHVSFSFLASTLVIFNVHFFLHQFFIYVFYFFSFYSRYYNMQLIKLILLLLLWQRNDLTTFLTLFASSHLSYYCCEMLLLFYTIMIYIDVTAYLFFLWYLFLISSCFSVFFFLKNTFLCLLSCGSVGDKFSSFCFF